MIHRKNYFYCKYIQIQKKILFFSVNFNKLPTILHHSIFKKVNFFVRGERMNLKNDEKK